jgi:uncharacterized SAM-binding protein YcdF (DUF218 family)
LKLKFSLISALKSLRVRRKTTLVLVLSILFLVLLSQEKSKVLNGAISSADISDNLPHTDCGVVLTGASGRIREAFEVFAQKKFEQLIVSGVYKDTQLREIFPQLPFYPSIDPEHVILEKISGSTYSNAIQSLLVAETLKCKSILLMTSDIHMYRAHRVFQALFPPDIKIETYSIVHVSREKQIYDVYYESFKSLFYNLVLFWAVFIPQFLT